MLGQVAVLLLFPAAVLAVFIYLCFLNRYFVDYRLEDGWFLYVVFGRVLARIAIADIRKARVVHWFQDITIEAAWGVWGYYRRPASVSVRMYPTRGFLSWFLIEIQPDDPHEFVRRFNEIKGVPTDRIEPDAVSRDAWPPAPDNDG